MKTEKTLDEFKIEVRKARGKRNTTVSYSSLDYFKFYNSVKPKDPKYKLTISQFRSILNHMGKAFAREYLEYGVLTLPVRTGEIWLTEKKNSPIIKNGKVVVRNFINWDATLNLWHEDEEARQNKTLVKYDAPYIYLTKYKTRNATFKHCSICDFLIVRGLQKEISEMIRSGQINAFKKDNRL